MSMEEVKAAVLVSIETENSAFQTANGALTEFDSNTTELSEVVVAMDGIISKIMAIKRGYDQPSATYDSAVEEADEATEQLSTALAGSGTAEAETAISAYNSASQYLDNTGGKLDAAKEDMDELVDLAQAFINAVNDKKAALDGLVSEVSTEQSEKQAEAVTAAEAAMAAM